MEVEVTGSRAFRERQMAHAISSASKGTTRRIEHVHPDAICSQVANESKSTMAWGEPYLVRVAAFLSVAQ